MQVYVVTKALYSSDNLYDDFGVKVNCLSETVGVFASEEKARKCQEDLLNAPDQYEGIGVGENFKDANDLDGTYIDVFLEEMELIV